MELSDQTKERCPKCKPMEQSQLWYETEAKRLVGKGDVKEIASALAVRDAACALHVQKCGLLKEPEDADTIAFIDVLREVGE
jgi:hypothetical protein